MHTSGQWIEATYTMKPVKDTPQDKGSCITYARRYCISSILNLQIDDIMSDDDGNKASGKVEVKAPVKDDGKAWLNKGTPEYQKAIDYLNTGGLVMKIEEKYKLSKEMKTYFLTINKEANVTRN
jgi:hypothetical protein